MAEEHLYFDTPPIITMTIHEDRPLAQPIGFALGAKDQVVMSWREAKAGSQRRSSPTIRSNVSG